MKFNKYKKYNSAFVRKEEGIPFYFSEVFGSTILVCNKASEL